MAIPKAATENDLMVDKKFRGSLEEGIRKGLKSFVDSSES